MSSKLTSDGFVLDNTPNFALMGFSPIASIFAATRLPFYLPVCQLAHLCSKNSCAHISLLLLNKRKIQNNLSWQINKTKPKFINIPFLYLVSMEDLTTYYFWKCWSLCLPGCFNKLVASLRGLGGPRNNNNAKTRRKDYSSLLIRFSWVKTSALFIYI